MTTKWIIARITVAIATDQLWMLDPLAMQRAWTAQAD